ncbi:AAA family ATPase [Pelagibacterium halotolerans]|uniref:Cell division protein FtsH n=1 Tax=Pelagibacterium halotolerans (strain DSM 22347 / JCM 15775 / CGMCC 1.7692 / B2) TaxID=1082931 RepID=G4RDV3_PELHB|nr:AAA family ATPase [Pelagibacterium halotolerans]AEQ53865.1 cell division protein FtsH [Pelagibacterium halotolerans B2]QJR19990.1 AAA family ATPase [Pelagibacterium halotolerans]SEA45319.1 Peptidase family M41 [Pelagibacterium halotolerans]
MIDLPNIDEFADEIPQRFKPSPKEPQREDAETALAKMALETALSRPMRSQLKQHPGVFVLCVPSADWVHPVADVVKAMDRAPVVVQVTELKKSGGIRCRAGRDELGMLQSDHSLMFITHDPDGLLDDAVLAVADVVVKLPQMTAPLLRKTIRRVTGGIARGVTPEMARLKLDIILASIRRGLVAGECVAKLQRAVDREKTIMAPDVPRLDVLPVTRPVRQWSDQVLSNLSAVQAGDLDIGQVPFITLEGPPGTGKTLIANSLAATAGWTFVSSSIGGWFTTGDGALGGVARNVKAFVDQILASEPAIGFLDELDALPDRETMDAKGRDWWTPVITLFLMEIDRLRKSGRNVLLIGATNYYDRLDAALIRPGRLQQRISILPPSTEEEILAVFRYWLGSDLADVDLQKIVQLGRGATPAMIEGWVNAARATARIEGRPMVLADLVAHMLPPDNRSPQDVRAIAIHEIGHALVAHRLGHTVDTITIVPNGSVGGYTRTSVPSLVPTREVLEDVATVMLGGRAADMVVGAGPNAGAERDLACATDLLLAAIENQGLGETLVSRRIAYRDLRSESLVTTIEMELKRLLDRAIDIVGRERDAVLRLADKLVKESVISGSELQKSLGERCCGARSDQLETPISTLM